jgi:predicted exporter
VSLTILHVMALLLVVSLAVDFGIFLVEKAATLEGAARTLVSILTASLTTVLSFGLLSVSANPGLASLGITLTLGTTFGMLACLLAGWWIAQPPAVGVPA